MKEQIISFAVNIISNGVKSGLTNTKIKEGLKTYISYLKTQDFVDQETLDILNAIIATLPELVKLAKTQESNFITNLILSMYTEKYSKKILTLQREYTHLIEPLKPNNHSKSISTDVCDTPARHRKTDRCGNIVNSIETDRCGNPVRHIQTDRCGNPISRHIDSCGSSITTTDSCGSGRSRTRSSC